MDITRIVGEICEEGLEAGLSVERKDADEGHWSFELVVLRAEQKRYELASNVVKHDTSKGTPFNREYHRKMLKIGSSVYALAEGEKEDTFIWKDRPEQLKFLMEYLGVEDWPFVADSRSMVHMYEDVAKVIAGLVEKGCKVNYAGSEEKAEKLASLADA